MSDMTSIEMHNTPEVGVSIEQVGGDRHVTYHVDWEQMKHPTPAMFKDVGHLETKMAVFETNLKDEELEELAMEALDAIQTLKVRMLEKRGLSEDQEQNVAMGNLDSLPEVTDKEVTRE